jgi:NAD(P)-dependent dehydrogenase (short-subunit alcohol dehydrogenase family)
MGQEKSEESGEFAGLVAVVTGAAQGIGRAIAEELHHRGAHLVLVDCNASGVAATADAMRKAGQTNVDFVVADLEEPAAIAGLTERIAAPSTKVDVLVNNAGIEYDLPLCRGDCRTVRPGDCGEPAGSTAAEPGDCAAVFPLVEERL